MFKFLFQFLNDYNPNEIKLNDYIKNGDNQLLEEFIDSSANSIDALVCIDL